MAIPYCDKAHAACSTCMRLNSNTESEITPAFYCCSTASNGMLGGSLGTRLFIQYNY